MTSFNTTSTLEIVQIILPNKILVIQSRYVLYKAIEWIAVCIKRCTYGLEGSSLTDKKNDIFESNQKIRYPISWVLTLL